MIINDVIIISLSLISYFFIAYLNERGKNLATKKDIKVITREIEEVKSLYEKEYIKFQKELESKIEMTKSRLKTTEIYFQKQLEALESFLKLYRKIFPKYDVPYKELEDVYLELTSNFVEVNKLLDTFLMVYEAYLPDEAIWKIEEMVRCSVDFSSLTNKNIDTDYELGKDFLELMQETRKIIICNIKKNILIS